MRLGAISFINTLPIYHGLDLSQVGEHATLHYGTPAWLNQQALTDALDLTPVSMSHYLAHQDRLTLVPGLSVSSFGAVESVLFVSRQPWEQSLADLPVIPVTDSSASSVALLGWLLQQTTGQDLRDRFQPYPAGQLAKVLTRYGCALTIGDEALLFRHSRHGTNWHCHDLATLWHKRTGLPFVFAVWVTPSRLNVSLPVLTAAMAQLIANKTHNLEDPDRLAQVLAVASKGHPLPCEVLANYLTRSLDFNWTAAHAEAVVMFARIL